MASLHRARGWCRIPALAAVLALGGCQSAPRPAQAPGELPSLREVRSDVTPIEAPRAPELLKARPRVVASVQRVDLPLDLSTDEAWALVNENRLPRVTRAVWHANGLRVGVIGQGDVEAFLKALPTVPLAIHRARVLGSEHPTALRTTPPLHGTVTVDMTLPPNPPERVPITDGRLRLVARFITDATRRVFIDLLPHHYVPEVSLLPRDPLEKELDGRMFNELGIRLSMPPGRVVVVGLHRPWVLDDAPEAGPAAPPSEGQLSVVNDSPAPDAPAEADDTAEGERERVDEDEGDVLWREPVRSLIAPPLPDHLGKALLTAERGGEPVQMIFLITVEPMASIRQAEPAAAP